MNAYVVNLERDTSRWKKIKKNFQDIENINLVRFNAIYKRNIDDDTLSKHTTTMCKYTCPDSVIGCGMSHILVAKLFLENDPNDICLVLEDDVIPIYRNIYERIAKIINLSKNINWDVIKLHCHGLCSYEKSEKIHKPYQVAMLSGSTAAYILSKRGAHKIMMMKLNNHADIEYNKKISVYINNYPLFNCAYEDSHTSDSNNFLSNSILDIKLNKHSPKLSWYFGQTLLKIPIINYNIYVYHIIVLFLFVVITAVVYAIY